MGGLLRWGTPLPVRGLVALLAAGCVSPDPPPPPPVPFDTTTLWVRTEADSVPLLVEVADTDERRARGLMERSALDPQSGMIFMYDTVQGGDHGFWMWRTHIPLDVAFLDENGVVVRILTMEPCQSVYNADACPVYTPGVEWRHGLEVNRGWFAAHGIGVGHRVTWEGPPPG